MGYLQLSTVIYPPAARHGLSISPRRGCLCACAVPAAVVAMSAAPGTAAGDAAPLQSRAAAPPRPRRRDVRPDAVTAYLLNDFAENGSLSRRYLYESQSDYWAPAVIRTRQLRCPCGMCSGCPVSGPVFSQGTHAALSLFAVEEAL